MIVVSGGSPWAELMSQYTTIGTAGRAQLMSAYAGAHGPGIYVDTYYPGTAGTVVGVNGTPNNPVADFTAARTLANALGIRCYYVVGLLTLSVDHQDWLFVGSGQDDRYDSIDLDDVDCFGATFIGVGLTGDFAANEFAGNVACVDCALSDVSNITGTLTGCELRGVTSLPTGAFSFSTLRFVDCHEQAPFGSAAPSIACGGASPTDAQIIVSGYRGRLVFSDIADLTTLVHATFDGAEVTFDASCTSAITPLLFGDFELVNAGAVTPDVSAQTAEVVDQVLTAAHGAGPWT